MPFFVVQAPASSTSGDIVQSKTFSCLASAAVDDLVRISTSTNSFVDVVANNLGSKPVVGVIQSKPTTTTCVVVLLGCITDPDSTTVGPLWLSATGRFTRTAPSSGYLQRLGFSLGNGEIDFKPDKTMINRP